MLHWACLSFGAQWMGAYFQTPSAAPQPLHTDCVGKGYNCSCVDYHFHVSVRINPDLRHKSSVNNNPLGFAPVSSFLTTSSVSRSSGLLAFYLFDVSALCFFSGFPFVYLVPGPFLECFFLYLILGPATSPSLCAFLTGTTRF